MSVFSQPHTPRLSGWGRLSRPAREIVPESLFVASETAVLSRGLGRSYGDSALPPRSHPVVLTTHRADRLIAFDPVTCTLRAEAGVSLQTLNRLFLPRGVFLPVTPGTQHVTLGGAVAADVHGKNHHVDGTFGAHVSRLVLRVADGRVVGCSPDEEAELFWATVGGMGLTGHILEVELAMRRVPSGTIAEETTRVADLDAFIDALDRAASTHRYTVGWIDCLTRGSASGRGVLMAGDFVDGPPEPMRPATTRPSLPFDLPSWALGRGTVRAFNAAFYRAHHAGTTHRRVSWEKFFYPLDGIGEWNRMYGRRGFTQYQCVIPAARARVGAARVLDVLTRRGGASFLCVIKDCGDEGRGMLSFPTKGISIALDIPVRSDTQGLVDALNDEVVAHGGRIYLAKDAFTRREHFVAMEPRLDAFLEVRRRWDPRSKIRSAQSVRLMGDRP